MTILKIIAALLCVSLANAKADGPLRIIPIDSAMPTFPLLAKPGSYLGENFVFEDIHSGDVIVKVGVWEAGAGKVNLNNFPFTEYVLMISGRVIVTEQDGTSREFGAGDTFVIPRGWSGEWDVQHRMKKQVVRIGAVDP